MQKNIILAATLALISYQAGDPTTNGWGIGVIFGFIYGMFIEYVHHRFVLHGSGDYFGSSHKRHHRTYRGDTLQREDGVDVAEPCHVFPLAFLSHWAIVDMMFNTVPASFMITLCGYYILYEISHWATHTKDNKLDQLLLSIPNIRELRNIQIEWHLEHHRRPMEKYNFTWPFLGDILGDTKLSEKDLDTDEEI